MAAPTIRAYALDPVDERRALVEGLLAPHASISPKYLYDARGGDLFASICRLPEYYPTRVEAAILERHRLALRDVVGTRKELVDLGAGDCAKAPRWFDLFAPTRYVAVDIARDTLARALPALAARYPAVDMHGIAVDFSRGLDIARDLRGGAATFVYPGSSIGNFAPQDALALLRSIRAHCVVAGSGLLIGVDTKKDPARLVAAYDDADGVTAAFDRNVLLHVNRILGTRFDPEAFAHVARYDETHSRIEMHLEARVRQAVVIDGATRTFEPGERIHTENSYKYALEEFGAMLAHAGFGGVRVFQDDERDFAVYYAA
jgi:dimethylhistidine N-methyltransferase